MNIDGIFNPLRRFKGKYVTVMMEWNLEDGSPAAVFGTLSGFSRHWIYMVKEDGVELIVSVEHITHIALGNHLAELEVKMEVPK